MQRGGFLEDNRKPLCAENAESMLLTRNLA